MNSKTFCPHLWNTININKNGDIYSCCSDKPGVFGNIYKDSLKDIINAAKIRKFREQALDGQLYCYETCFILNKDDIYFTKKTINIKYHSLTNLDIVFGTGCNINCIMCYQKNKSKESLAYEVLVKNIDLTPFKRISFQGGEPLYIESAKKYFNFVTSHGKNVLLRTNGLLIDDEWSEKIAIHSKNIYISINGATKETHESINKGSSWERLLKNIQQLRHARDINKTELIIQGHMTIVPENVNDIVLFVKNFKQLGFDIINFSITHSVYQYLRDNPQVQAQVRCKIQKSFHQAAKEFIESTRMLKVIGLL